MMYTPENERMSPKKSFNRKYIFQPSFFRGYVSFEGDNKKWGEKKTQKQNIN